MKQERKCHKEGQELTLEYVDARKEAKAICHMKKKEYEENIFHYSRNS
jgi:hypothetical protein